MKVLSILFLTISTFFTAINAQNPPPSFGDLYQNFSASPSATGTTQTQPAAATSLRQPAPRRGGRVTLPMGETIVLGTMNRLDYMRINVDQTIQFLVQQDVIVDGKVVISTNTPAMGIVTYVQQPTSTSPAAIGFKVQTVRAVNGETIILSGTEQIIKAPHVGMSHEVSPGTLVRAVVRNNQELKL